VEDVLVEPVVVADPVTVAELEEAVVSEDGRVERAGSAE
jgi:hypothetical protein